MRRILSQAAAALFVSPLATPARIPLFGVRVNHKLAVQIDPLRFTAGAEITK
jgi:hypothetical protein